MKSVQTARLTIIPLEASQLKMLADDLGALERALIAHYCGEKRDEAFLKMVARQVEAVANDPANEVWNTLWLIMRNEDRLIVGSFDFKGAPDADGRVEIGYGLAQEFRHCGYMTETVRAMCRWARLRGKIYEILAETECDNLASQKVLYQCGFIEQERGARIKWSFEV